MAQPFLGEIRIFGGSYAPQGWSLCNGQIIQTDQNEALFSLLGSTYGGNGRTTFALPNLQGRAPMHVGSGTGLTPRSMGQLGGQENVTLTINNMPHTHELMGTNDTGTSDEPTNNVLSTPAGLGTFYEDSAPDSDMVDHAIQSAGSSAPTSINNMQPYLVFNFIIALIGEMPTQT